MVRRHRRFELLQVTIGPEPVGSATVDVWEDDDGRSQWSARVLLKGGQHASDGLLTGSTRDGRRLAGRVRVAEGQIGPRGARTMLVALHGLEPLIEREIDGPDDEPEAGDATTTEPRPADHATPTGQEHATPTGPAPDGEDTDATVRTWTAAGRDPATDAASSGEAPTADEAQAPVRRGR